MKNNTETVFAIGYSTRKLVEFIDVLQAHSINLLVDIRKVPRSRHMPKFNMEHLKNALKRKGILYKRIKGLEGFRKPDKLSKNKAWRNASFRGFADHMQTREFTEAINKLISAGKNHKIAIMCAEGNPFRCHRLLIADALLARHIKVFHISSRISEREHKLTSFAKIRGLKVTYP